MDSSTLALIVSVVVAVVAIVPGVWALVNQAKKDASQAKLDMNKAANDAAMGIIAPLQAEVARLQTRVLELEKLLIDKTNEIGELMQSNIDKDSEIRTMKYSMQDMQRRLNVFETKRKSKVKSEDIESGENVDPNLEEELAANEAKKEEIKQYTIKSIEHITNGSLVNTNNSETEEK